MAETISDNSSHPSHEHSRTGDDVWRESPLRYLGYSNEVCSRAPRRGTHSTRWALRAPLTPNARARTTRLSKRARIHGAPPRGAQVGEAFRPLVASRLVHGSYAVATAYVLGDTWDKSRRAGERASNGGNSPFPLMATTALDVLSWQTLASVAIPGVVINRVVAVAGSALRRAGRQPGWAPTALGLAAIPLIIGPIDAVTDALLDRTVRPAIEKYHRGREGA